LRKVAKGEMLVGMDVSRPVELAEMDGIAMKPVTELPSLWDCYQVHKAERALG